MTKATYLKKEKKKTFIGTYIFIGLAYLVHDYQGAELGSKQAGKQLWC